MKSKEQLLSIIEKESHDRYDYLNALFQYIPESIVSEMTYIEVKKNENIVIAGKPCDTIYIILKGNVVGIDYHKMGNMYSFMDFTKMYIVGDFEIFTEQEEYGVTIRTSQECKMIKISAKNYRKWIKHDENALYLRLNNVLTTLTFERKLDRGFLFMGSKERVVNYLVRYYEKENKSILGNVRIDFTQAEFAEKIGVNIRSVQRCVSSLEMEELLSNENGKIVISYDQYMKLKRYEIERERRK